MKHLFALLFIFFLTTFQVSAQSDFREGYIIKSNTDTTYGLIDYAGSTANAKKCTFRKDVDAEIQVFTPKEILGYRFLNGKYYVSRSITVGDKTEQLFLEYLINGIVDIYYYRGDLDEHYLIDDGGNGLHELKNEENELKIDDKVYVRESKEYIGLLKYVFNDSPTVSKKAENTSLNHKSLINIAHDYHMEVCEDEECLIYEKKLPKTKGTYGIVVGLGGMSLSAIGDFSEEYYYLNDLQSRFDFFSSIGLYFKKNNPFVNERLFFQYELTYSLEKLSASSSYHEPVYNMDFKNDIVFIQNTIGNLLFLKYEFPKGRVRPSFQAGGFLNYCFKSDYTRNTDVTTSLGEPYRSETTHDSPLSKYNYGVNCGIGLRANYLNNKELFIDFRYQRGFGLLEGLNTNRFSLNLGFQIGK